MVSGQENPHSESISLMHIKFPNKIDLFLVIKNFNLCLKKKKSQFTEKHKNKVNIQLGESSALELGNPVLPTHNFSTNSSV